MLPFKIVYLFNSNNIGTLTLFRHRKKVELKASGKQNEVNRSYVTFAANFYVPVAWIQSVFECSGIEMLFEHDNGILKQRKKSDTTIIAGMYHLKRFDIERNI